MAKFKVREPQPVIVIDVVGEDGHEYEIKLAILINTVIDTGTRNPLEDAPIFSLQTNGVMQVSKKKKPNA